MAGRPADRAGLRLALDRDGIVVCAEADDARTALEEALRTRPDVCLLTFDLPGGAVRATAAISAKVPETAVVVLADPPTEAGLFEAVRAGAAGYLPQNTGLERLPFALRGVARGEAAVPRALVAGLVDEFRRRGSRRRLALEGEPPAELTAREWEVLDLMGEGLTTAEMAQRLFISQVTVRTHVAAVLRKLHVPDREAAVHLLEGR